MVRHAALTICSINYLAKALVLFDSFKIHHPSDTFYIVLVDRKDESLRIERSGLNVIWVEDLGIPDLLQYAFSFDVIEFNTNVKPTALKFLLTKHESVLYIDPDMKIYAPLTDAYKELDTASLILTPHSNTPILDGYKPDDLDLLKFGAFNLGFVGVSSSEEGVKFLDWWSSRCLSNGFYEPQLGLAVDQKWVNLAPIFFPNMRVFRHVGFNVAFWNLHERIISNKASGWVVNDDKPLVLVHFSSFNAKDPDSIAQKQTRFVTGSRPDFSALAHEYAKELIENESDNYSSRLYSFDYFDDGTYVTPALRRFYAGLRQKKVFENEANPFSENGPVKIFAKKNRLLIKENKRSKRHIFKDIKSYDKHIRVLNKLMYAALFILGPERYFNLMRYMSEISSLRKQSEMFGKVNNQVKEKLK